MFDELSLVEPVPEEESFESVSEEDEGLPEPGEESLDTDSEVFPDIVPELLI